MRIAYFTESLPPLTDGVARTFTRLAEFLTKRGVEFLFVSPALPHEAYPWRGRVIQVPSLTFPLYCYYRVGLPNPAKLDLALDRFRPDLLHVAAPTPLGFYAQGYAKRRGLPSVASYHTHFVDYFPYYGFKWASGWGWAYLRYFYNRSAATFVPTPSAASDLAAHGFKGVQLWPRGIDRRKFSPLFRSPSLRKRLGLEPGEKLFLFAGRMVGEKGLRDLSQAAGILRDQGCRFRMVFAGDGPYRKVMENFLPGDIFLGFTQGRALSELYASSDLFLFPSPTETFGNVVLEAFASGLPVVAVNQGGPVDLVRPHWNGLLAKPRDPEDFAAKVRSLLDSPEALPKLSEGALETASRHDWFTINGRLLSHYGQVLRRQHGPHPAPASRRLPPPGRSTARLFNRRPLRRLLPI